MALPTAPTEDPKVHALLESARLEASADGKIDLKELFYDDLKTPGAVKVGDKVVIHRGAERDVDRGWAATLWLEVMDIVPGSNKSGAPTVAAYEIVGTYRKPNADAENINGRMILHENALFIAQPQPNYSPRNQHAVPAYANFQFSAPAEPIRIYVQRAQSQDAADALSLDRTLPMDPLDDAATLELDVPRTATQRSVASILRDLGKMVLKVKKGKNS